MINEIVSGVCGALSEQFGENYKIYTEKLVQGAVKPCFCVACDNQKSGSAKDRYFENKQLLGSRYLRSARLRIEFHPVSDNPDNLRAERAEIMDELFLCLEYIKFKDGLLRGEGMQGEFDGETLNFFVNYNVFVISEVAGEKEVMGKLTIKKE